MATREEKAKAEHRTLLKFERKLWRKGVNHIGGLDEAGAGPLAGPVVAGCVVLDRKAVRHLVGVKDSKKLPEAKREEMAERIKTHALAWSVAEATVEEIDRINIREAGLLAMQRAYADVENRIGPIDHLLIDARELAYARAEQTNLIKGDSRSLSIAAASILAKVARDHFMMEAAARYPGYGFEKHKGYGTAAHTAALKQLGVTPLHRRSFATVRALLPAPPPLPPTKSPRRKRAVDPNIQPDLFDPR